MKQMMILGSVIIILVLSAYNLVSDDIEMHQHNDFFKEMREFKARGGRNTSDMGEILCDRINMLEFHLKDDVELTDCEAIYDGNADNKK